MDTNTAIEKNEILSTTVEATTKPKSRNPKKTGLITGGLIVVVALVVVLILLGLEGEGYKKPIDEVLKVANSRGMAKYQNYKTAGITSKYNEVINAIALLQNTDTDQYEEYMESDFESLLSRYQTAKFIFEFAEGTKLSDNELNEYEDNFETLYDKRLEKLLDAAEKIEDETIEYYADRYDQTETAVKNAINTLKTFLSSFKNVDFKEGYKIKGSYVMYDESEEKAKTKKSSVYVVKYNGNWLIIDNSGSDVFAFNGSKSANGRCEFLTYEVFRNTLYDLVMYAEECLKDVVY